MGGLIVMLDFLEIDSINWKLIGIGGIVTFIVSYILSFIFQSISIDGLILLFVLIGIICFSTRIEKPNVGKGVIYGLLMGLICGIGSVIVGTIILYTQLNTFLGSMVLLLLTFIPMYLLVGFLGGLIGVEIQHLLLKRKN
jgi:hypothetical protein